MHLQNIELNLLINNYRSTTPFHLGHSDVWCPSTIPNNSDGCWFISVIDAFSDEMLVHLHSRLHVFVHSPLPLVLPYISHSIHLLYILQLTSICNQLLSFSLVSLQVPISCSSTKSCISTFIVCFQISLVKASGKFWGMLILFSLV